MKRGEGVASLAPASRRALAPGVSWQPGAGAGEQAGGALRIALLTAALPILATVRSTTEVNSSKTTSCALTLLDSGGLRPPARCCASNARARSHRNRSPLLSAQYGLTQDGGLEKPTAVSM